MVFFVPLSSCHFSGLEDCFVLVFPAPLPLLYSSFHDSVFPWTVDIYCAPAKFIGLVSSQCLKTYTHAKRLLKTYTLWKQVRKALVWSLFAAVKVCTMERDTICFLCLRYLSLSKFGAQGAVHIFSCPPVLRHFWMSDHFFPSSHCAARKLDKGSKNWSLEWLITLQQ